MPSSRGEFLFYKVPQEPVDFNDVSTRMSIMAMEITLHASILQVWSIWNLLCICVSDCEKSQQSHLLEAEVARFEERG